MHSDSPARLSLAQLNTLFRLEGVQMLSCECKEANIRGTELPQFIHMPSNVNVKVDQPDCRISADVTFRMQAAYDEDTTAPASDFAINLTAKYRALYSLSEESELSQSQLAEFCEHASIACLWPLWREFVISMMQRMSLPPLIVPLLNMAELFANVPQSSAQTPSSRKRQTKASKKR